MKQILAFVFLSISIFSFGQESVDTDSVANIRANDSVKQLIHQNFSNQKLTGATKTEGDSAYIKGDFKSAIVIYESLLKNGESADIYYNLGNSYYKADEIAKAVLNYERALLIDPGNEDIRANLEIARLKTLDKTVSVPDVFLITWMKSLVNSRSIDSWAITGIIFFVLFIAALYFFIFSKIVIRKKIGFIGAIICLIVVVSSNIFASQQKNRITNRSEAIIMPPSVTVRSTPSKDGTSLFILHEGHKVTIKDSSMKEWKEIRLEDNKVGWVPTTDIEII